MANQTTYRLVSKMEDIVDDTHDIVMIHEDVHIFVKLGLQIFPVTKGTVLIEGEDTKFEIGLRPNGNGNIGVFCHTENAWFREAVVDSWWRA